MNSTMIRLFKNSFSISLMLDKIANSFRKELIRACHDYLDLTDNTSNYIYGNDDTETNK